MAETYLGDGLYASIENGQVKLRTPRMGGDHEVYMESGVLKRFLKFVDDQTNVGRPPHDRT